MLGKLLCRVTLLLYNIAGPSNSRGLVSDPKKELSQVRLYKIMRKPINTYSICNIVDYPLNFRLPENRFCPLRPISATILCKLADDWLQIGTWSANSINFLSSLVYLHIPQRGWISNEIVKEVTYSLFH